MKLIDCNTLFTKVIGWMVLGWASLLCSQTTATSPPKSQAPKTNASSPIALTPQQSVSLLKQEIDFKKMQGEEEWNYDEAYLYWLKQRAFPNDTIKWTAYTSAFAAKAKMDSLSLVLPPGVSGPAPKWENIGPFNLPAPHRQYYGLGWTSGRVNAVAYDPTTAGTMFIASAGGGLWQTTDDGKTWTPRSDKWENTKVSSIAIAAQDSQLIYVGTGDFDGGRSAYGFGVMKSVNGGKSWIKLLNTELKGYSIHRILIYPDDSNVVLVTAGNSPFGPGKVFRTETGGNTWVELTLPGAEWTDASCGVNDNSGHRLCFIVGTAPGGQVWRSSDQGAHWGKLSVPLSTGSQDLSVANSPTNPKVVYILSVTDRTILKSEDGGDSWTSITNNFPMGYNWSQGAYDHVLACSSRSDTHQDVLYVGLIDLVTSFDEGRTWISLGRTYQSDAVIHNDQHALAVNPRDPNELLVGNDGGVYRGRVDPATRSATFDTNLNSGIAITQFYRAAFHPADADRLLGGAQDNATPALTGDKMKWLNVGTGDGGFAAINPKNPLIQYATAQGLVIMRTDQEWRAGSVANISADWGSDLRTFIAPIALDPTETDILYAGTNYLWKRDDRIGTWTERLGGTMLANDDGKDALTYIAIAPSDSSRLYTGSQEGELWMSKDKGDHWAQLNLGKTPLPRFWITSIAVHPHNPNKILVSFSGTASKTGVHPGHVWVCEDTQDANLTWHAIIGIGRDSLPNIPVNSLVIDSSNPDTIYYAGTDIGFFVTKNGGRTWEDASASLGLPNVQVNDIQYVPGTNYLMVATFGRGIWRLKFPFELEPTSFKVVVNQLTLRPRAHSPQARAPK